MHCVLFLDKQALIILLSDILFTKFGYTQILQSVDQLIFNLRIF